MNQVVNFNMEECISKYLVNNKKDLQLFIILYLVNILIYGQKLFFTSLSPDDYIFFISDLGESASWLGRWAETLFNQHIFTSQLVHVLPYLNGLLGIFLITLSGYITGKIFGQNKMYELTIITLLISATPYFAHFLYFNSILSAWIGILLSVIGLFFLYKKAFRKKIFGFIFIVLAIGTYQAVLQVLIAIIMIKTIIVILSAENKSAVFKVVYGSSILIMVLVAAYVMSNYINHLYLDYHHLKVSGNFAKAHQIAGFSTYIERLMQIYSHQLGFRYFSKTLHTIYSSLVLLSFLAIIYSLIISKQDMRTKTVSFLLISALFAAIPLITNLPMITGAYLPLRSQFAAGWFTAGAFMLITFSFKGILRSIGHMLIYVLIASNIYYINVFYYAAQRQTQSDIINANQIVNRIRLDSHYTKEPLKFKIEGTKLLSVKGWDTDLQAFGTEWSHYWIFKYFTNLQFSDMNESEYQNIQTTLIGNGVPIESYPGKNSIFVKGNKAVLFLDTATINQRIYMHMIRTMTPVAQDKFTLYLYDDNIIYYKSECTKEDIKNSFFLRVTNDQDQTQNLDFQFGSFGMEDGGSCIAVHELPTYTIQNIFTGQVHDHRIVWSRKINIKAVETK